MKVDCIIAGGGLAGSLLAWFLLKKNKTVLVVDDGFVNSSSRIAAGIIHPITGRRLVKTNNADALIPFAFNCYHEIETALGEQFFYPTPILETFTSIQHRNEWMARSTEEDICNYVDHELTVAQIPTSINAPLGGVLLKQSGWLSVNSFIKAITTLLQKQNSFVEDKIKPDELIFDNNKVVWRDYTSDKLILCDGYSSLVQHFFSDLTFVPAKGEVLTVHCKDLQLNYILNQKVFVLPIGENIFKVGSTFSWKDLSTQPTVEAREQLTGSLKKMINADFEIINHQAAIRPTTKDRKPFVGFQHHHKCLGVFNGLGTKGVMLGPYYAEQLSACC